MMHSKNYASTPLRCAQASRFDRLWIMCFTFFLVVTTFLVVATLVIATPVLGDTKTTRGINIEVTTYLGDNQTFKQGDKIAFLVSLDKDAHLLMIYQDANNNLIQVIPNRYRPRDLYQAGLFIAVPDSKEPFEFVVNPPFGEEQLWVFASANTFPALEGEELGNGLRKLNGNLPEILQKVRANKNNAVYGESTTLVTTTP